ncbi:phenazine antibiotic biosynthesis protein [Actinosynnema sp. CS-041913]|uniref:phenazine antibiotic biosynthesis protein n=1 Tax=Actinosynnema sp. CS-041913 TaxID=3239917 RepID=UPI003D8A8287
MEEVRTVLEAPPHQTPDPDEVVAAAMAWHFDPATGSPFWLRLAEKLPFTPQSDIRTVADLSRFPDLSAELRTAAVADLVPRGCAGSGPPTVFESGGTTGPPKRVVDFGMAERNLRWYQPVLDAHGFPAVGDWLYLGPTGPHLAGWSSHVLARLRESTCFTVDLDPRWVKRRAAEGDQAGVDRYVDHILTQAGWILETQDIAVLFATPPLLEGIAARDRLAELAAANVRAVLWGGTSMDAETRRLLSTEVFDGIPVVGVYGNTLMGAAPQRPGAPGDEDRCVFQPFEPYTHITLVDEETGRPVDYGERGRVLLHRLDRDVFLPSVSERDTAVRMPPAAGFTGDGVADIRPVAAVGGTAVIEGVY